MVRTLATVGNVIIVGRAGACATRGLPHGIHVRLIAPEPWRVARMRQLFGLSESEARQVMARQDRDRARLVTEHFQQDINDPLLYHAVWNTGMTPLEEIARSLIAMIRVQARRPVSERTEVPAGP